MTLQSRLSMAPEPNQRRFATTRWSLVLATRQAGLAGSGLRARDALRDLLVPGLRLHSPQRTVVRRRARPDAGVLHARAREELFSRRRADTWPVPDIPPGVRPALHRQRTRRRNGAQARRRVRARVARSRDGGAALPSRTERRRHARASVRAPMGARGTRRRDEAARGAIRGPARRRMFDELRPLLTGDEPASYAVLSSRLGATEGALRVAVHRLRRQFATQPARSDRRDRRRSARG